MLGAGSALNISYCWTVFYSSVTRHTQRGSEPASGDCRMLGWFLGRVGGIQRLLHTSPLHCTICFEVVACIGQRTEHKTRIGCHLFSSASNPTKCMCINGNFGLRLSNHLLSAFIFHPDIDNARRVRVVYSFTVGGERSSCNYDTQTS